MVRWGFLILGFEMDTLWILPHIIGQSKTYGQTYSRGGEVDSILWWEFLQSFNERLENVAIFLIYHTCWKSQSNFQSKTKYIPSWQRGSPVCLFKESFCWKCLFCIHATPVTGRIMNFLKVNGCCYQLEHAVSQAPSRWEAQCLRIEACL